MFTPSSGPGQGHDDQFFRTLVEASQDFIVVIDHEGKITYVSPSLQHVLRFEPAQLFGHSAFEFIHPEDHATAQRALADELAGTQPAWYIDVRLLTAEGEWIPVEVKGWRDRSGEATRVIVHARDLRWRKKMERLISEQDAWMRALVAASPLAIITVDTALVVRSWNPAAERIFDWKSEEVLGLPLPILPEGQPEERDLLWNAINAGKRFDAYPTRRARRDGRLIDVNVSVAPIYDPGGRITGAIKLVADTSQQRALDRQYQQSQAQETAWRLAGGIAHDFNNLLATILASAEFLLDETPVGSQTRADVESIVGATAQARELTQRLLGLGRRPRHKVQRIEVGAALQGQIPEIRDRVDPRIGVESAISHEESIVAMDPDQLRQLVDHLVQNACDAMPHGGTLTIEATPVLLDRDTAVGDARIRPGEYVLLAISDTGEGMSNETVTLAFEPFFTTHDDGQHQGLGLATAYAMARQVGGGIAIVSVPDVGTTVRVYLPRVAPETPRRPSGEQRTIPGDALATDQRTILLVEDDGTLRASIRRALLQAGFEVLDAAGGAEALVVNETHPEKIHLLVTDVVMPDVSGRELASRMRALRPDLKVLFMSGFSAETIRASGGLGSSEAFVQKPFTPSALVGAVRGLVEFL
jgi:PAS domain S-box-containing protein